MKRQGAAVRFELLWVWVAALVIAAGCRRQPEYDGIGAIRFGQTTQGQFGGLCQPRDEHGEQWCSASPLQPAHHVTLGGQSAEVSAGFAGAEASAPLVRLELYVPGCRGDSLRNWLIQTLGDPSQTTGERTFWRRKAVFVALRVPAGEPHCVVNLVRSGDLARIALLHGSAAGALK